MKYAIIALVVAVAGLIGLSTQPQDTSATNPTKWPPLSETCYDVDGDGTVDLFSDILSVIQRYGTVYGGPPNANGLDYALLYDVDGGKEVNLFGDILGVIGAYGQTCTLVDQQVVLATVATMKYQNCQDALTDGYIQSTQMVPNMGIHLAKNSNVFNYPNFWSGDPNDPNDQIRHPAGLICTDSDPGDPNNDVPDKLIGMWYVVPNMEACPYYGNPSTCNDAEPEGFAGPEDNTDLSPPFSYQKAWHKHPGLCVWGINSTQAGSGEGFSDAGCSLKPQPNVWFSDYGWMVHLYNYIPNEKGRFLMFSTNVP